MVFEVLTVHGGEIQGSSRLLGRFEQIELLKWIPSIIEFPMSETGAFCFVPLNTDLGAFCYSFVQPSRTIGVREQVVTRILPFARDWLNGFHDNSALLAYYCLSAGTFYDSETSAEDVFSTVTSIFDPLRWSAEYDHSQLSDLIQAMQIHDRAVAIHSQNPVKLIAATLARLESERRWFVNYGFGSLLSHSRRHHLQICQQRDAVTTKFLVGQNIRNFDIAGPASLEIENCSAAFSSV